MIRIPQICRVRCADRNNQSWSAEQTLRFSERIAQARRNMNHSQRRGVVMILAIIVLILSSSISLSMIRTTSLRQQRFENRQRKLQATLIADSAIERVKTKLIENGQYSGEVWKIESLSETGEATIRVQENSPREYAIEIVAVYPLDMPDRTQVSIQTTITLPASTTR